MKLIAAYSGDGLITFPDFAQAVEDVFDESGQFSQTPSLYKAETDALGQMVMNLTRDLEAQKREKEDLQHRLESQVPGK